MVGASQRLASRCLTIKRQVSKSLIETFEGLDVAHGILYKGRPPVACRLSDTKTERLLCLMSVFLYACQSSPLAPVQISHLSFSSDG